jgi:hypothetical protein
MGRAVQAARRLHGSAMLLLVRTKRLEDALRDVQPRCVARRVGSVRRLLMSFSMDDRGAATHTCSSCPLASVGCSSHLRCSVAHDAIGPQLLERRGAARTLHEARQRFVELPAPNEARALAAASSR